MEFAQRALIVLKVPSNQKNAQLECIVRARDYVSNRISSFPLALNSFDKFSHYVLSVLSVLMPLSICFHLKVNLLTCSLVFNKVI